MGDLKMRCPYCQVGLKFPSEHQGRSGTCPRCQMQITFQGEAAQPAQPPQGVPLTPEAPPPPAAPMPSQGPLWESSAPPPPGGQAPPPPAGPQYPERMKANRALAGRTCPGCHKEIDLGDDVFNCPKCQATMHLACHEACGACAGCQPPVAAVAASAVAAPVMKAQPVHDGRPRMPCRFCSEMIPVGAAMCGFCGEYQNDAQRVVHSRTAQRSAADDSMNVWEILLAVLCGGIGCIVGIVYACQGKKKGGKMILLAIAMSIFWTIIRLFITAAMQGR